MMRLCVLILLAAVFMSAPVCATNLQADNLVKARQFLTAIAPQTGRFEQTLPSGDVLGGQFWLDFPHRFRFAYQGAAQQVITVDDKWLSVQAAPGAQANRFPVGATPLAVIRKQGIGNLDARFIARVETTDTELALTLRDPDGAVGGQLTLFFTRATQKLAGWQVVDIQNQTTRVRLYDVRMAQSLPRRLFFVIEDEPH